MLIYQKLMKNLKKKEITLQFEKKSWNVSSNFIKLFFPNHVLGEGMYLLVGN